MALLLASPAGCARCWRASARALRRRGRRAARRRSACSTQAERPCGVLAYGDLKRVELAMALANQPRLLLMDEPTAGMAPRERVALMALAARLAREQNDRRAVHRARHGRGVRPCRPHHRAGPRRADRRGHARGGARRSARCARSIWAAIAARSDASDERALMLAGRARTSHAYYGRAQILYGVSLEVGAGEVVALLGRNGAGKSTTMKAIMGLVPPAAARCASPAAHRPAAALPHRAGSGLGYVPEERRIFTELTVMREPRGRPPAARATARRPGPRTSCSRCSPISPACASGRAGACRAASSRC